MEWCVFLCRSGDPSRIVPNSQGDCQGSTNALHRVCPDGWIIAKIADDLYCRGNTLDKTLYKWGVSFELFTVQFQTLRTEYCCPSSQLHHLWLDLFPGLTMRQPSLCLHPCFLLTPLPLKIVWGLYGFIGTHNFLTHVVQGCSSLITFLHDQATVGLQSNNAITWSDSLFASILAAPCR